MPEEPIKVIVPSAEYRSPKATDLWWDTTGVLLARARQTLGRDMAYSVILSRVARELRRELGDEGARQVFQGFCDTMLEAKAMDRNP